MGFFDDVSGSDWLNLGSNLLTSYMGSEASKKAAKQQAQGLSNANDITWKMYQQTRDDQTPWRTTGGAAMNRLGVLMGLSGGDSFNPTAAKQDTIPAKITPAEAVTLKNLGGAGVQDPRTGFMHFYPGGSDVAGDSGGNRTPEGPGEGGARDGSRDGGRNSENGWGGGGYSQEARERRMMSAYGSVDPEKVANGTAYGMNGDRWGWKGALTGAKYGSKLGLTGTIGGGIIGGLFGGSPAVNGGGWSGLGSSGQVGSGGWGNTSRDRDGGGSSLGTPIGTSINGPRNAAESAGRNNNGGITSTIAGPGYTGTTSGDGYGSFMQDFTAGNLYDDPSYQWRLDQNIRALDKSAAAKGTLFSGQYIKDLSDYTQGQASTEYGNAWNRYQTNRGNKFNMLSNLASLGQGSANTTANTGMNAAGLIGNNWSNIGDANAAGTVGSTNSWLNGINNGINNWNLYRSLNG